MAPFVIFLLPFSPPPSTLISIYKLKTFLIRTCSNFFILFNRRSKEVEKGNKKKFQLKLCKLNKKYIYICIINKNHVLFFFFLFLRRGRNVLNQKSELDRVLEKQREAASRKEAERLREESFKDDPRTVLQRAMEQRARHIRLAVTIPTSSYYFYIRSRVSRNIEGQGPHLAQFPSRLNFIDHHSTSPQSIIHLSTRITHSRTRLLSPNPVPRFTLF